MTKTPCQPTNPTPYHKPTAQAGNRPSEGNNPPSMTIPPLKHPFPLVLGLPPVIPAEPAPVQTGGGNPRPLTASTPPSQPPSLLSSSVHPERRRPTTHVLPHFSPLSSVRPERREQVAHPAIYDGCPTCSRSRRTCPDPFPSVRPERSGTESKDPRAVDRTRHWQVQCYIWPSYGTGRTGRHFSYKTYVSSYNKSATAPHPPRTNSQSQFHICPSYGLRRFRSHFSYKNIFPSYKKTADFKEQKKTPLDPSLRHSREGGNPRPPKGQKRKTPFPGGPSPHSLTVFRSS